jgi:hypothetical protein
MALLNYAEHKVNDKFLRKRVKDVRTNKSMINPKVDYQIKNRHIETGVEDTLRYFDETQIFVNEETKK